MGADTDFNALYGELGVAVDCSIEEFTLAYRRRVGSLHPDRLGSDGGLARLQQLNRSYAQATEFHRLHGRLPGAARAGDDRPRFNFERDAVPDAAVDPRPVAGKPHPARYSVLVALVAAALLWLHETNSAGPRITLGMAAKDVRTIQGNPVSVDESRWEYGPSWIEFRCGKVVDWYSAPRQPLRVDDHPGMGGKPLPSAHAFEC